MSEADAAFEIRRILLALDASPGSLAALEAAVDLAAKMEAELSGLFVEDEELMHMAESPLARQVLYPAATQTAVSRASLEREMKSESERARKALESAAQRAKVRWSFRTVKGQVTRELLAAAGECDVLAVGRVSWHRARSARIGSTALELATGRVPLLVAKKERAAHVSLVVYFDESADAQRALLTAAQLARAGGGRLTVFLAAPDPGQAAALQNRAAVLLKNTPLAVRYCSVAPVNEASLRKAVAAEKPGLFVMASRGPFRTRESIEKMLLDVDAPVLWLGDGPEPER